MLVAIIISLLAGFTNVLGRTLNAKLTAATSQLCATLMNYVTGLVVSGLILLGLWQQLPPAAAEGLPPLWILLGGGALGVATVTLLNLTTHRISAFYLTLLTFVGQVFTGVIIDIILTKSFSWQNLLGGVLVSAGLAVNLAIDRRDGKGEVGA
ncbi:DMT family transporter [Ruminococcaceae bacterium OttesenSCG-928-D13]|nr:DMT family transporter [Ruminococcaceae bacterium OttesenSCG-928-D13]